jgi:hypothetical protein
VVQLSTHGTQAGFYVSKALAVGQLRKSHGQILIAAGEASMVRISAIALDALLELVGRQMIQELGEDGLSGIHPSLLTIDAVGGHPALVPVLLPSISNRKMRVTAYRVQYVSVTTINPILAGHY